MEQYEKVLNEIDIEKPDWKDIKRKYNINCHHDTIRKAATTIFGGKFVYDYMKDKESKANDIDIEMAQSKYRGETSINKDGSYTSDKLLLITEEQVKDPVFMLNAHGFDPLSWELINAKNNIWNVYSKQDGIKTLYSSKVSVKPVSSANTEMAKKFYEELIHTYVMPKIEPLETKKSGLMYEIPIFDLHINKKTSVEETGEDYNTDIARKNFNYIIDSAISEIQGKEIEKIIFPIGNDFFNSDTFYGTTTNGTHQDNDFGAFSMFKNGCLLLIDGINKLSSIAPVEVFCVNGNHDFLTSYHSIMTLWAYFNTNPNVIVNTDSSPRKYISFGKCLLGFTHGDKEKARIDGIMQIEAPEAWGKSVYREWHMGHLHSEHLKEKNGLILRNLSSVTGSDMWHHTSGYVGSIKKCQCFLWHKEDGLKTIYNFTIK